MEVENKEIHSEEVVVSNRWKIMFGHDVDSGSKFIDYLARRIWRVRGELIDTEHRDKKKVSTSYLKSLVEESGYFESKAEVKEVCNSIVELMSVTDDYIYQPVNYQTIEDGKQVFFNKYESPCLDEVIASPEELMLWDGYWVSLLPDEIERTRVLQWVAHVATKPEVQTGIAVLLHGSSTGTGKSTLGEVLTNLVGKQNATKPTNPVEALTGRFNGLLEGKVLFIVDELYEGGSFKVANGIKDKITEPRLTVERKGLEAHTIDNYCNFYATSNHLTPLWLDEKDRRWEVYAVEHDDDNTEQRKTAVKAFREWFELDRAYATKVIRGLLSNVDIAEYKPWVEGAMETEAKRKLISNSTSNKEDDFELHWNEHKCDDNLMVNASALFRKDWASVSSAQRTDILTKLGCQKLEKSGNVKVSGIQSRHWWVTPKGLEAGIETNMAGGEIRKLLEVKRPDVTNASYDAASDTLSVSTQMRY